MLSSYRHIYFDEKGGNIVKEIYINDIINKISIDPDYLKNLHFSMINISI